MSTLIEQFRANSALFGANADFIEDLYESYLQDPATVDANWRRYFDEIAANATKETPHGPVREAFLHLGQQRRNGVAVEHVDTVAAEKQAAVLRLINAYRVRGHQAAKLDPLGLAERRPPQDLEPAFHGLLDADLDNLYNTGSLFAKDQMALRDILDLVNEVYTGTVGAEYMHITDTAEKRWIQERLEVAHGKGDFSYEHKHWLLKLLTAAEGMEKYLHTRYVGQKRFSLEGGETMIPMIDEIIQRAGGHGVKEVVLGMAHRGRLNVLVNIFGKAPSVLFQEFEGKVDEAHPGHSGDVKYHKGFSSDVNTPGGPVHMVMAFNPSHLEIVNPVVEGSVRARQERRGDDERKQVLPILIHGDSAFAGQGVVMETLQLSQTRGYSTGGTVHIVVNNQVGFTTSNPNDTRSTEYCTDIAKMVQAPIFHVNGDDPEAAMFVTQIAVDYCQKFNKDVVIDLICYRRHGHNEADEPAVTQPKMYEKIRRMSTTRTIYAEQLAAEGVMDTGAAQQLVENYREQMDIGHIVSRPILKEPLNEFPVDWSPYLGVHWTQPCDTNLTQEQIQHLAERLTTMPEGFKPHPRVSRILEDRKKMAAGNQLVDWGFAENMAYASLVTGGYPIRLSGQDAGRGTFFHRHAQLHSQVDGSVHIPLQHISEDQEPFVVIDSLLSEEAVLGFEYGYATAYPESLVIWEAQFGDFVNGAQVVIDQFISAGEAKWGRLCGLMMLLPHGYEGQGPEHSSARPERFKQLCAQHNMQLCSPTTPAQMFHMIRRQALRPYRKPLVVMSPKSLLRHKLSTSPIDALTHGQFRPVFGEVDPIEPNDVKRVVMCTGKVYFDLLEARRSRKMTDVAIIRIEQVYPFPKEEFIAEMEKYPNATEMCWCQEEPQNQGMWDLIKHRFQQAVEGMPLRYSGRASAASPAVGYHGLHVKQQEQLVDDALTGHLNPATRQA